MGFISDIDETQPDANDPVSQGDDQIRAFKADVKSSFPNVDSEVSANAQNLNALVSATGRLQNQIHALDVKTADLSATSKFTVVPEIPTASADARDSKAVNAAWVKNDVSAYIAQEVRWEYCGAFDLSASVGDNGTSIVFLYSASVSQQKYLIEDCELLTNGELNAVIYHDTGSGVQNMNVSMIQPGNGFYNASATTAVALAFGGDPQRINGKCSVIYDRETSSIPVLQAFFGGDDDCPAGSYARGRSGFGENTTRMRSVAFYTPEKFVQGRIHKWRLKKS